MKTIYTSLPVYDRISKQCYQRATVNKVGQDVPVPIMTPRHKLPAMQWNVETDDPGAIKDIRLFDQTGDLTDIIPFAGLNSTYNTFTIGATDITCVNTGGDNAIGFFAGPLSIVPDELYIVDITLAYVSGQYPYIRMTNAAGTARSYEYYQLKSGVNRLYFRPLVTEAAAYFTVQTSASNASFNIYNIAIHRSFLPYFFKSPDMYATYNEQADSNWSAYDTISVDPDQRKLDLVKTTNGVNMGYWFRDAKITASGITAGEEVYIVCNLTLTSGTAPRFAILEYDDDREVLSNVVTLSAGYNYITLKATTTKAHARVELYNISGTVSNFSITLLAMYRSSVPILHTDLTNEYFQYSGELGKMLDAGTYFLRFETVNSYLYYSDYFQATCIYPNLVTEWETETYDTFTVDGVDITSAINTSGAGEYAYSNTFSVRKDEVIKVYCVLNTVSGQLPTFTLEGENSISLSATYALVQGTNEIDITVTDNSDVALIRLSSTINSSFGIEDVLFFRAYSSKYLTINYSNTCDLGDIIYQYDMNQTIWFESETMEPSFTLEEEGQKNGEGRFVRTFGRQVKKYLARTKEMPDYMVDVFNRMRLHDTISLTDLVGDTNVVYNLEVEHEWLHEDKYYAKIDLTFDYDETALMSGCCTNVT
jgi:hypothetical protein